MLACPVWAGLAINFSQLEVGSRAVHDMYAISVTSQLLKVNLRSNTLICRSVSSGPVGGGTQLSRRVTGWGIGPAYRRQ